MEFFQQRFRDMYKGREGAGDVGRKQAERRRQLLKDQKKQREEALDKSRGDLVSHIEQFSLPHYHKNLPYKADLFYRNKLQLSEWLREKPEDLDNWFLVPCPKGKRHLVVASGSKTIAYTKSGKIADIFQSSLQSGRYLTVLDCIYNEETHEFYVLDCLVYHNQEFLLCDTTFRFFWIKSKFEEYDYGVLHQGNQYAFHYVERFECARPDQINEALHRHPFWPEDKPELDGFLFYHKDANYVHGKTPLVGWLFPFMVSDILGFSVHPDYLLTKPDFYNNALSFMSQFDQSRRKARKKQFGGKNKNSPAKSSKQQSMDVEELEDDEIIDHELDEVDLQQDQDETDESTDQKHISIFKF